MKFLEARRIVAEFPGGPDLRFVLGMSGTADALLLYLQAAAAERGYRADVATLPFGTFGQALRSAASDCREVFLLFPWDLCAEADWRSGNPREPVDEAAVLAGAQSILARISERPDAALLYVPASIPPLMRDVHRARALPLLLEAMAVSAGAILLPSSCFALESYYRSGFPLAADALGTVARSVVDAALPHAPAAAKVLVTDFDNTLWAGVVGEDGPEGVQQQPEGTGYVHFMYQTYLRSLRSSGILLAGVTRNDHDLAIAPLRAGRSVLTDDDFIAVVASYSAKSAQIAELARALNLGLDAFVFVDDNPVELAEVSAALPALHTAAFPARAADLPGLLARLARLFHRTKPTQEDRERTELYRRRLAGLAPVDADGADLSSFLASLHMRLTVHDRSSGDRSRAVQLINKTNQFNLNGIRRSDSEVDDIVRAGGRLLTASLEDRHGAHGEILAYLVDCDGVVRSFVLSCRVFQRQVEHAFLAWLAQRPEWPSRLEYKQTERNEPIRRFLEHPAFRTDAAGVRADRDMFMNAAATSLQLFELVDDARGASV